MKKVVAFFFIMVLASSGFLFVGCGLSNKLQVNMEQINDRLSICVLDTEQSLYLDQPLTEYKKKYPDVEIEIKTVAADDIDNQRKEIAAELMAGEGADLYLNAGVLISDIYKAQEAGALEDLMPWFRKTEGFSEDDYMDGTFDLYEHTDSCYIFAAQITGREIAVRKDMEKELEIDVDSWLDSSGILDAIEIYYEKYPEEQPFLDMEAYSMGLSGYGYDMSDEMKIAEILNSPVFRRDMMLYKRQAYPQGTYVVEQYWEDYEMEKEKLFRNEARYLGKFLYDDLRNFIQMGGEKEADIGFLYSADGKMAAEAGISYVISAGSHNKENAFRMLQMIIETEEKNPEIISPFTNKKLTKEYIRQQKEKWMKDEVIIEGETYEGLTEKVFDKLEDYYMNATVVPQVSYPNFVDCMEPYFKGESEMESCIEEFRDYLEIYYSE